MKTPRDGCHRPGLWSIPRKGIDMQDDSSVPIDATYSRQHKYRVPEAVGPEHHYGNHSLVLTALGEVVYAIRTKDRLIKIGHTTNLATRRRHFSSRPKDLLAFAPGTLDDEQTIHAALTPFRARGHEYYHPVPEVLTVVNEMREDLGLSPLVA